MGFKERFRKKFAKGIEKLFGTRSFYFESIAIKSSVIEDITDFARNNHPREFVALLGGRIKNATLYVESIIFQNYFASHTSAFIKLQLPMITDQVGSAHSHSSVSNSPSTADIQFFNRNGFVHLIISYPYTQAEIAAYTPDGRKINFTIIK